MTATGNVLNNAREIIWKEKECFSNSLISFHNTFSVQSFYENVLTITADNNVRDWSGVTTARVTSNASV